MMVEILSGGVVIGRADLNRLDPPMGTAEGTFERSTAYDRASHAEYIDGVKNADVQSGRLTVKDLQGSDVECVAAMIEDYDATMAVIQVTVFGIPYPAYEGYFGSYDAYKRYYAD